MDNHGHAVFSLRCRRMEYCGGGIYKYWKGTESNCHFINRDGQPLVVGLPNGFDLEDVLISAENYDNHHATTLPDDTLLIVKKEHLVGVIDLQGKFRIGPDCWYVQKLDRLRLRVGQLNASTGQQEHYLYNLRSGSKLLDNERLPKPSYIKASGLYPFEQPPPEGFTKPVLWGYKSGTQILVPAQFEYAGEFVGAYASVTKLVNGCECCYLIDKNGQIVSPAFGQIQPFNNELAIARPLSQTMGQGLVNPHYKFVLPPHFFDLTFLMPGLYAARGIPGGEFLAISSVGKELFALPKETISVSAFDKELFACTRLMSVNDEEQQRTSLLNSQGKIAKEFDGYIFEEKFNLHSTIKRPMHSDCLQGLLDDQGNWVLQPHYNELKIAEPDRIVCTSATDDFDSEEWNSFYFGFIRNRDRKKQFAKFLENFNLIGMDRTTVYKLLGGQAENKMHDQIISYGLQYPSGCGFTMLDAPRIDIKFDGGDKVIGWRFGIGDLSSRAEDKWVVNNVVCSKPNAKYDDWYQNLKPKGERQQERPNARN